MADEVKTYSKDKQFTLPNAFTALNGCVQTFKLTSGVTLSDGTETAKQNLLRILEVLRSNGAQPIITQVNGKNLTFTLEQANVYGKRGADIQVSERNLKDDAVADIKALFTIKGTTDLMPALKVEEDGSVVADESLKLFASVTVEDVITSATV